jgi:hypothetical protein
MMKIFEKDPTEKFMLVSNSLIDDLMPILAPVAFKIVCLIYRNTKGWHKDIDQISFSQIMKGTGIKSSATVAKHLSDLYIKGVILRAKSDNTWDANSYALNPNFDTVTLKNEVEPTLKNEVEPTLKNEDTKDKVQTQKIQSPNGENGTSNKQPIPQPTTTTEPTTNTNHTLSNKEADELLIFGKHPDSDTPNPNFDIIQEIQNAGWQIRDHIVEQAIVYYIEAVRNQNSAFAVPNNKSVRNDWYKAAKGHLQDYRADQLKVMYPAAVDRLKERGMTFSRPGSLTKSLPDVAMDTQAGDVVAWL